MFDFRTKIDPNWDEFLNVFGRELALRQYQQKTIRLYTSVIRQFSHRVALRPRFVEWTHIDAFLSAIQEKNLTAAWRNVCLSALRMAFDELCGMGVTHPFKHAKRPPLDLPILDPTEVARLIDAATCVRDKLLITLAYVTGARLGEILSLRCSDYDPKQRTLTLHPGPGRRPRKLILPIPLAEFLSQRILWGGPSRFLFPRRQTNTHLAVRSAQLILKRTASLAYLPMSITFRSLRHTFAVHSLQQGASLQAVIRMLGNRSLDCAKMYREHSHPNSAQESRSISLPRLAPRMPPRANQKFRIRSHWTQSGRLEAALSFEGRASLTLSGIQAWRASRDVTCLQFPLEEDWCPQLLWLNQETRDYLRSSEFRHQLMLLLSNQLKRYRHGVAPDSPDASFPSSGQRPKRFAS